MRDGETASGDLQDLRAINKRFIHNFITNDVPGHSRLVHERFVCLTARGKRDNRADYLVRWATGFDPEVIVYWDIRDESIDVFGNVALVRSTNKHVVRRDGRETTGMTMYTDTYLREGGEWRCIQAQSTPVAPEHYPGDETIIRRYVKGVIQDP